MYPYISTNTATKAIELAIVNAEGSVLYQKPVRLFMDVAIAYRGYRAIAPQAPKFSDIEPGLLRQWQRLMSVNGVIVQSLPTVA